MSVESSVIAAFPGTQAVFKADSQPDIVFDVVAWQSDPRRGDAVVRGLVVVPGQDTLSLVFSVEVPPGYVFVGYSYCPPV